MRSRHVLCILALVCLTAPMLVSAMPTKSIGKTEDLLGQFWRVLDANADKQVTLPELYSYFAKIYTQPAKNEQVRGD